MQLYDKLLGLPLFLGMSSNDLQEVVTRVRFGFNKYPKNKIVVSEDQPCDMLYLLVNGGLNVITESTDHSFSVTEQVEAPYIFQPERIFGLIQRHSHRYVTRNQCHLITIMKDDVMHLSEEFLVFRMNLLNIISADGHRMYRQMWMPAPRTTRDRVIRFLKSHCHIPTGKKVFHIKMTTLANEINEPRLEVSNILNELNAEGKIILQRSIITIPLLEEL